MRDFTQDFLKLPHGVAPEPESIDREISGLTPSTCPRWHRTSYAGLCLESQKGFVVQGPPGSNNNSEVCLVLDDAFRLAPLLSKSRDLFGRTSRQ